jgi:hypothetical protein
MIFSKDLLWELLATNFFIGYALISLLHLLLSLCPSRFPARLQLFAAMAGIYVSAIAINIALPDFFDALSAYVSAQAACTNSGICCYAAGQAIWTNNFTLQNRLTLVICNRHVFACHAAAAGELVARVAGYFKKFF